MGRPKGRPILLYMETDMNRVKIFLALLASLIPALCACGQSEPPAESAPPDLFHSDATAIDFLEGYWTNGRGEFITASRGDDFLIVWETNLPIEQCEIYVLSDAVLKGGRYRGGALEELALLRFEKLSEDSLRVESLADGRASVFLRDSFEPDEARRDDSYVFWSMRRAARFLSGMWMASDGSYFTVTETANGAAQWNYNLPIPDCDYIDFCDGALCAVTRDPSGVRSFTPLYTFSILGEDSLDALCHLTGQTLRFERLSRDIDLLLLESRYLFSAPERAFAFLEGMWLDGKGNYFSVENINGYLRWHSNLSVPYHSSYSFSGGSMVGVDTAEDGTEISEPIYDFTVISADKLEMRLSGTNTVYTLTRRKQ